MKSLVNYVENKKIKLLDVKAGQMFLYGNSKFVCDDLGYATNLTCGKRMGYSNFPHSYETRVTLINSCYCFRN